MPCQTLADVDEGGECVDLLAEQQSINETVHAGVCTPSKPALSLTNARSNPAMHKLIKNCERTRDQCDGTVALRVGGVTALEDWVHCAGFPRRQHQHPVGDGVKKLSTIVRHQ